MNTSFSPNLSFKKAIIHYEKDGETNNLKIDDGKEVLVSSASYGFNIQDVESGKSIQVDTAKCLNIDKGTQLNYTHHNGNQEAFTVYIVGKNGVVNIQSDSKDTPKNPQIDILKVLKGGEVNCFNNSDTQIEDISKGASLNVKENAKVVVHKNRGAINAQNGSGEYINVVVGTNGKSSTITTEKGGNYKTLILNHYGQIISNDKTDIDIMEIKKGSSIIADGPGSSVTVSLKDAKIKNNTDYNLELKNGAQATNSTKRVLNLDA